MERAFGLFHRDFGADAPVEPFDYLSYLFEHLPSASTLEAIEVLLPWNVKSTLQAQHTRPSQIDRSVS